MALRVMAVSAPENKRGFPGRHSLKSADPVSLYNALRYAGSLAVEGLQPWGDSNMAGSRANRRDSTLLMHSFEDDLPLFIEKITKLQPNLLLIGAMTVCLPGAIACAKTAREILGDKVCIVLGGKHVSESIFLNRRGIVTHHASSPLLMMANHKIDRVFDIVISGEGEFIIAWIGEVIDSIDRQKLPLSKIIRYFDEANSVPGKWIMGTVFDNNPYTIASSGVPIDKNFLPSPCEIFGIHTSFNTFGERMTAHVFSDISHGCVFNCNFCSESRNISGPPTQINTGSKRLHKQMLCAVKVVSEDNPDKKTSAFIEDSTILTGSVNSLRQLANLLNYSKTDIRFGGQLTIDQICSRVEILRELKMVGLDYLFIGIETLDPTAIGGMSKDIMNTGIKWIERVEQTICILNDINIKCGAAILFGLGESHQSRIQLFQKLNDWKKKYKSPNPISINYAVQHPLCGNDGGTNYTYIDWGIPTDEWLKVFCNFGEASVLYPLAGQNAPVFEEIQEVSELFQDLI